MKQTLPGFVRRLRCERGQDATEYVLLATLIGLVVAAAMMLFASSLDRTYADAAACVQAPSQAGSQGKGGGTGAPGQGKGKGGGTGAPGQGKGKGKGPPTNPCP